MIDAVSLSVKCRVRRIARLAVAGATLSLLPLTSAIAQTLPDSMATPGSTSLEEVVQQAILTNPEVQAAWNALNAAGHDEEVARGNYLPSVDVSAGIGREDRQDDGRGSFDTDFAELTLNQMIYDGFATRNEVARLNHAELTRYYELIGASENTALEAVRAYLDVKRFRELVRLAQENYADHLQVFKQIEQQVMSGTGRGADLEQISGRLALAESNLMTEASNLHDVTARYQRIVGKLPAENLAPAPSFDDRLPESMQQALALAFEGNPDFHAAIENIAANKAEREGTGAAFHPRLDLRGRTGTNNESGVIGQRDEHSLQLVLSMNLYRGGSDLASFRAASERVEQAINQRQKACNDIRQTTQIAYNDSQRLREQLTYLNQHRQSIDRVRNAYQQQFDIGQRSLLDVLDSENEYFDASRAYANAQFDVALADARTLASMGQLMQVLGVRRDDMPTLAELGGEPLELDGDALCPSDGPRPFTLSDFIADIEVPEPTRAPDVTLSADALFALNSAELSERAKSELDELVSQIRGIDDLERIFIAGHADSTGNDAINDPLSQARADSVAHYLVSQGIDPSLIATRGYGSREPVASNATVEGRRLNRRVEVTLERSHENLDISARQEERAVSQPTWNRELARPGEDVFRPLSTEAQWQARETSASATRFLQVAALRSESLANGLGQRLASTLDVPFRLEPHAGFYRVRLGPIDNTEQLAWLHQRLKELGHDDSYIVRG